MTQSEFTSPAGHIIESMIRLARCAKAHRIIVAGSILAPAAALVIWVDSSERARDRKLASILERLGFRIEAGTRCERGFAICARRRDTVPMNVAA